MNFLYLIVIFTHFHSYKNGNTIPFFPAPNRFLFEQGRCRLHSMFIFLKISFHVSACMPRDPTLLATVVLLVWANWHHHFHPLLHRQEKITIFPLWRKGGSQSTKKPKILVQSQLTTLEIHRKCSYWSIFSKITVHNYTWRSSFSFSFVLGVASFVVLHNKSV